MESTSSANWNTWLHNYLSTLEDRNHLPIGWIPDPVEPWLSLAAIELITGVATKTLSNKQKVQHPQFKGFYRLSSFLCEQNEKEPKT